MKLILNTNELGYKPFLSSSIETIIVGLKNFCHDQLYTVSIKDIPNVINELKTKNKKLSLSINIFALESDIAKLDKIVDKLLSFDIDSFIVGDLGVLNLFKRRKAESKVVLDLQTYVTNKYSAKSLLNLGVKRIVLSKEITLDDIKEIAASNNKLELLTQGFYPITYSKRPILRNYYKHWSLNKNSKIHYIKEESRDDCYFLMESKNDLSVYYNKQYSLFNFLDVLYENNIDTLRIDTNFLKEGEIKEYIDLYTSAIKAVNEEKKEEYKKLKEEFNKKFIFDTPFLHNESFLLKEGK